MARCRGKFSTLTIFMLIQTTLIVTIYIWSSGKINTGGVTVMELAGNSLHKILATTRAPQTDLLEQNFNKKTTKVTEVDVNKKEGDKKTSNSSSHIPPSYRSFPKWNGVEMETNKVTDDYSYCFERTPFLGPYNYTAESKNPCWWESGVLRCVPYFYLVGFSKCGTSDLFARICKHPDVSVTGGKEKHWFDYKRFMQHTRFIQNYSTMFEGSVSKIQEEVTKKGHSNLVMGDGTPCYAWGSLNWPCYQGNENAENEPLYTNADMMYHLFPGTKIIIILREPVSRLYSRMLTYAYQDLHPAYKNPSAESFYNHVMYGIKKYEECFQHWSHRACAYNGTLFGEVRLRLQEGMYNVYVKDWIKVFPKDQILILRFDDYIKDSPGILEQVYSFLGLATLPREKVVEILSGKIANEGRHYDIEVKTNETTAALREFYRPFVLELAELLGDKKFAWDYE